MARRAIILAVTLLAGCGSSVPSPPMKVAKDGTVATNPSFPTSIHDAAQELATRQQMPRRPLDRPLVICGGFMDVGLGPWLMERSLRRHVSGQIITVQFSTCTSLQDCREKLVRAIDDALGPGEPGETREVDVIGQSMGGLIAVHAALDDPAMGKRVKVRRMFTICSPLRGAKLAMITQANIVDYQRDLRPGSALSARLASTHIDYELISYARLRDGKVGEQFESLPGQPLWWVDTPADEDAHDGADFDPRILLDLVRRLRDELPLTTTLPTPLPTGSE